MSRERILHRRIRWLTWLFIAGLFISGATAIPLLSEVNLLAQNFGTNGTFPALAAWLLRIRDALAQTQSAYPFLFYGTDWLAFGHFVIAIAFIGALRDPVRNRWLFDFGLIACVLVVPYALVFGGLRGIPIWWRLMDCSFGVFEFVPLWFCRRWAREASDCAAERGAGFRSAKTTTRRTFRCEGLGRPGGTCHYFAFYPALKCRAIVLRRSATARNDVFCRLYSPGT